MSDNSLRAKVIRLAHSKPELREHLLPLVTDKTANIPVYYAVFSKKNKVIYFFGMAKNEKSALITANKVAQILRDMAKVKRVIPPNVDTEMALRRSFPKATDAIIEMVLSSKYPLADVSTSPSNFRPSDPIEDLKFYKPVFLSSKQMGIFKNFLKQQLRLK